MLIYPDYICILYIVMFVLRLEDQLWLLFIVTIPVLEHLWGENRQCVQSYEPINVWGR